MKIRAQYRKETKSYADHTPAPKPGILDCSLGVNPYGPPAQALEAMAAFDLTRMGDYPHSAAAHQAICRHWAEQAALTQENLLLVDGSVSGLYLINALFAQPGAEVVGFFPAFTDMIVNVEMQGMVYRGVTSSSPDRRESVEDLLAAMDEKTALVYIDNPNNPTGQCLPKQDILPVLDKAKALGAYVLVDEAYGDFVGRQASILSAWADYDNLIVLRTFSKGFGLAGLRAGYIVAPAELIGYMEKTTNPYSISDLGRLACAAAMDTPDYPASHGGEFAQAKQAIRRATGNNLTLLATDDRVPICTLRHKDPVDLQALLYAENVLTVSGAEFDSLGENSVRLRVPRQGEVERLVAAIAAVERR